MLKGCNVSDVNKLENYLIDKSNGFLFDNSNNGKTIMLSGAWGSGKTHFWKNKIEPSLSAELKTKQKTYVYVSLYGKESIAEIKYEILKEAYNNIVEEDLISKGASLLSSIAPGFGEKSLTDAFEKLNQKAKNKRAKEILEDGSVICLDDFERKSKSIDLNDLFGIISYFALDLKCKVAIILNSEYFIGKDAKTFKEVKEKTVNKYFYYNPEISELFELISINSKYDSLNDFKETIKNTIEETGILNARIYIQVLDNCLEWIKNGYEDKHLRAIILSTICFIESHILLKFNIKEKTPNTHFQLVFPITDDYPAPFKSIFSEIGYGNSEEKMVEKFQDNSVTYIIDRCIEKINRRRTSNIDSDYFYSNTQQQEYSKWLEENKNTIISIFKYGYKLYLPLNTNQDIYNNTIVKFIESGILLKAPNNTIIK